MRGIFNLDSPLMRGLSKLSDLIILNLITFFCCIPIVTIGAASSALYYSIGRIQREEGTPVRDYFRAFKENFKQATVVWLIFAALGALLVVAILFYISNELPGRQLLFFATLLVLLLWAFCLSWVFPLQARFVNTTRALLQNALVCTIGFLPKTILITLINALPVLLFLFAPELFLLAGFAWFTFWFSAATYWNLKLLRKPFEKIMGEPEAPVEQEESAE